MFKFKGFDKILSSKTLYKNQEDYIKTVSDGKKVKEKMNSYVIEKKDEINYDYYKVPINFGSKKTAESVRHHNELIKKILKDNDME